MHLSEMTCSDLCKTYYGDSRISHNNKIKLIIFLQNTDLVCNSEIVRLSFYYDKCGCYATKQCKVKNFVREAILLINATTAIICDQFFETGNID